MRCREVGIQVSTMDCDILQGYGDAEFGGDLVPRRSTTGNADYVFTLAECVNGWKMVLHEMLVSSIIEAEHMVVADASRKALRWKGLVRKFRRDSIRVLNDYTNRSPADMKTKAILVEKFKIVELAPWTPAKGGG